MKKLYLLSTQYSGEDDGDNPTIQGVFTSKKKRRDWINADKKRIREEGYDAYEDDYIQEWVKVDPKY